MGACLIAALAINAAAARSGEAPRADRDEFHPIGRAAKQVYRLLVQTEDAVKSGSAFLVSGKRVIATNNHVVDKGRIFMLAYLAERGGVRRVTLRLLASFPQKDLALLQAAEDLPGEALSLAVSQPEFASDLYAIGYPSAADLLTDGDPLQNEDTNYVIPSVVKGAVSRIMTGAWLTSQLQHQTPISPGYSGGPLVDRTGVVVGVSSAIHKHTSGISYGVSAPDLANLLAACSLKHRSGAPGPVKITMAPPMLAIPEDKHLTAGDRAFLKRANELLTQGNIVPARQLFEYLASQRHLPEAFNGLARTYDPRVLNQLTLGGSLADADKARLFYDLAGEGGGVSAATAGVQPAGCDRSLCILMQKGGVEPVTTCRRVE